MMSPLYFVLAATFLHLEIGISNVVAVQEKWGYVNVRKDAHMFWWLYHTDQEEYSNRPLILWIQGGPGASGAGIGNFLEIGPFDVKLQPRKSTWLSRANLLFIDSPAGTGFSYVTEKSALVSNNAQITEDLLHAFSSVLQEVPEFKKSPLYIFSESYGGKMTVDFALVLESAIESKTIECNFKGISLGDSWISPRDHVSSWGDYFHTMSLLDDNELAKVKDFSRQILRNLDLEQYAEAGKQYQPMTDLIGKFTYEGDWYNFLKNEGPVDSGCSHGASIEESAFDELQDLMNGPIRQKFGVIPENVIWKYENEDVFEALEGDFMKGVLPSLDNLLNNHSHLKITVYNGQLDPIVNTLGVLRWIKRLKWSGLNEFQATPKQPILLPGNRTAAFLKSYKQLSFFWVLKAGHYVPFDAPEASLAILDMILSNDVGHDTKTCSLLSFFCS